jgi:putative GTP pyrophosphokinase
VPDLRSQYEDRRPLLVALAENLEREFHRHFEGVARIDRISFRAKTTVSFIGKLERHIEPPYTDPLIEVEDQVAGRILVHFLSDVEPTRTRVEGLVSAVEEAHRRPTRYNEFDYESFHGIYGIPPVMKPTGWQSLDDLPRTFELQIRTLFQHAYAEPQHDLAYKPDNPLDDETRRELAWIAASSWGADHALQRIQDKLAQNTACT